MFAYCIRNKETHHDAIFIHQPEFFIPSIYSHCHDKLTKCSVPYQSGTLISCAMVERLGNTYLCHIGGFQSLVIIHHNIVDSVHLINRMNKCHDVY